MSTVEKIYQEAIALPPDDLRRLIDMLSQVEAPGKRSFLRYSPISRPTINEEVRMMSVTRVVVCSYRTRNNP
jgi:hypothetical protein